MVSTITVSNLNFVSRFAFTALNFSTPPSLLLVINPRRTRSSVSLNLVARMDTCLLGYCDFRRSKRDCGFVRRCKGSEGEVEDSALEAELLEFMQKSENPVSFPTKKELVDAGRMDLVEGIKKQGGWLCLGWDLDDGEQEVVYGDGNVDVDDCDTIMRKQYDNGEQSSSFEQNEVQSFEVNSSNSNSSSWSALSSGRSLETEAKDDTGIEGILSRLEKHRNLTFGIDVGEKGFSTSVSTDGGDDWYPESSTDATIAGNERSSRLASSSPSQGIPSDSGSRLSQSRSFSNFDSSGNSVKPETWRSWSLQRAGFSDTDFEPAEIVFHERKEEVMDASKDEILITREGATEPSDRSKELSSSGIEIDHKDIQTRLHQMELELASTLHFVKLKTDAFAQKQDHEVSSDNFRKLSDDWEFQENEIMNAQGRWRSIRAKLAVLEGKMALAIIDAQKIADEKQKQIDSAHRALQLLRTTYIIWPTSASEVLLAGSFDGWTTQRKMERSSTGVFSLCLKLYPGKYEFKFIVDGNWRIDPLRPIVQHYGYENNLLIIT